jgi:hypothetical protein
MEEKIKKSIDFFDGISEGALEMKKDLEEKGYKVNHILSASPCPVIIDKNNGNFTPGIRSIVLTYGLPKDNNYFK